MRRRRGASESDVVRGGISARRGERTPPSRGFYAVLQDYNDISRDTSPFMGGLGTKKRR